MCRFKYECMWSVDIEHVAEWLASVDDGSRDQVVAAPELLKDIGHQLAIGSAGIARTSRLPMTCLMTIYAR